jgi:hypothetical protein
MFNYTQLLDDSWINKDPIHKIAKKIYFLAPSYAFESNSDLQLALYEEIGFFLNLPISSIRVVGSAHTGFSLVKGTPFDRITSDLDIAIIDGQLYLKMFESAFRQTDGWRDLSKFSNSRQAADKKIELLRYMNKGIICPELMPSSPSKAEWGNFFGKLGDKYSQFCNGISARVYAHDTFMSAKQHSAIEVYFSNKGSE